MVIPKPPCQRNAGIQKCWTFIPSWDHRWALQIVGSAQPSLEYSFDGVTLDFMSPSVASNNLERSRNALPKSMNAVEHEHCSTSFILLLDLNFKEGFRLGQL